jgi:general secretion pathway protein D
LWTLSVVALATCPFVLPVDARGQEAAGQQPVRLNYVNAELGDVIRSLSAVLGVNVLLTEDVPERRVTYSTERPVPVDEVGIVLEAILESQGLVMVRKGPVAEVMPAEQAPFTGPVYFGTELSTPIPLGLITQIVPLQHIRAQEGVDMLIQVASPLARIEIVPRSNSILITDLATNIVRYLELLRGLDIQSDGEAGLRTFVYRLKHANASELAITLAQTFGAIVPAIAPRARVGSLSDRSLSSTLETFRQRELESLEARRSMQLPIALQAGVTEDTLGAAAGPGMGGMLGQTTIVPEPATNSLVIRTSPPNFPVLQETIEALDVRPAQVLLEVHIVEVMLDKDTDLGVNWSIFAEDKFDDTDITARLGPQAFSDEDLAGAQDFILRVVRLNSVDVRGVIRALATETDVRVLSNPRVLALNNEEARILVGNQVPFSQSTRAGLDVVVDQTIQYRNVGTQLTVIPTINEDGYVTFRILQEVSNLTAVTLEAALNAPLITTREAETSALVRNGQTIVIGGLIDRTQERFESGIPLLKDIPLLGLLFSSSSDREVRTELAIFLTPYVVFTDEDADALFERERQRLENTPEEMKPDTASSVGPDGSAEGGTGEGSQPAGSGEDPDSAGTGEGGAPEGVRRSGHRSPPDIAEINADVRHSGRDWAFVRWHR